MRKPSYKHLTLLLTIVAWSSACAERVPPEPSYNKIVPADIRLSEGHIRSHTIRYEKGSKVMNYSVEPATIDDQAALLVSIDFNQGPDSKPDQIWIDSATHSFRKRLLSMPAYTIEVSMKKGHFSGALTPTEGSDYSEVNYDKQYPHNAFEPAIVNYAIAALPLSEGYTASIPVIDLNKGSQMFWSNVKVLGEEMININGTDFNTWKVESDGIRNKTIWIDKQTRLAIKMKTSGNPGAWKINPESIEMN